MNLQPQWRWCPGWFREPHLERKGHFAWHRPTAWLTLHCCDCGYNVPLLPRLTCADLNDDPPSFAPVLPAPSFEDEQAVFDYERTLLRW